MPLNAVQYEAVTEPFNKPQVKQVQDEVTQNAVTQQFAFPFHIHETQGSNLGLGSTLM
jgi:hypothetical protein